MPLPMMPYQAFEPGVTAEEASRAFYQTMRGRRSVRHFSERPVSKETIATVIRTAGSAPSGANKQPWRFVCVSDSETKARIRVGAEQEERLFYEERASDTWLSDLEPIGTDANKAMLEQAPWLIAVFRLSRGDDGSQVYYAQESVGIAAGFLLAAIHHAGLAALTHTPSPMKFLGTILGRPEHEKPFLLIPVGYPADGCQVPALERKALEDIAVFVEAGKKAAF